MLCVVPLRVDDLLDVRLHALDHIGHAAARQGLGSGTQSAQVLLLCLLAAWIGPIIFASIAAQM